MHEHICPKDHVTEEFFHVGEKIPEMKTCHCGRKAQKIISESHLEFKNIPKIIDDKHKQRMQLLSEQKSEQILKEERNGIT